MYTYYAYNLYIGSEIELPELAEVKGKPEVYIRVRDFCSLDVPSKATFSSVVGEIPGVAKVLIQRGVDIFIDPFSQIHPSRLSPNLLGGCMAVILMQRGRLTLHASCVGIRGHAVAFLGHSGEGKSTLAAAFHAKGYPLITDDVLAVQNSHEGPMVVPSFARIKLWPASLAAVGPTLPQLTPLYKGSHKWSYVSSERCPKNRTFPLKRIYLLDRGDEHAIQPLPPQEAFAALLQHRRAAEGLESPELAQQLLLQISQLINQITLKRFTRRPSLEALPELVSIVEADLAQ